MNNMVKKRAFIQKDNQRYHINFLQTDLKDKFQIILSNTKTKLTLRFHQHKSLLQHVNWYLFVMFTAFPHGLPSNFLTYKKRKS